MRRAGGEAAPPAGRLPRHVGTVCAAGAVLLALSLAAFTRADNDLWGHVRFGLDALERRDLPVVDPYSFTQDRAWINHEWLSEIVLAVGYASAGPAGLALVKGALVVLTFVVVWSSLRGLAFEARLPLMLLLLLGSLHSTVTARPQLWTLLGVALLCRWLTGPDRGLWLRLPLLFLVWANLHGGWIVGAGILGTWAAVQSVLRPSRAGHWAAVLAFSLAATLVNPYGVVLWTFLIDTVEPGGREIAEWQPLSATPPINWIPWSAAALLSALLLRRHHPNRWATVAVLFALALGALRVMRLGSLFVVAALVLLAPIARREWPQRALRVTSGQARVLLGAAAVWLVAALGGAVSVGRTVLTCLPVPEAWLPDRAARQHLQAMPPGRLVVPFDWGEYAIWHLGPTLRVSIDGRRETVYSLSRVRDGEDILAGTPAGHAVLKAWSPEYVWLPAGSRQTRTWLADNGYRIDLETERSFVAVRVDVPPRRPVQVPPATARRCFPD
jgi:hypothetical protein